MAWNDLLVSLRAAGNPRAERFAGLLEMDLDGLANTGAEGIAWGDRYGDHVTGPSQDTFRPAVASVLAAGGASSDDFLQTRLEPPLLWAEGAPSFEHATNAPNKIGPAEHVWGTGVNAVRYLPLSSFLQYFLDVDPYHRDFPPPTDPAARARAARDKLADGLRSLGHPGRPRRHLGNPRNGRTWVTAPEADAPHAVALARGDAEADVCTWVVRRMGLTGYEQAEQRADKIGIAALHYPLGEEAPLYRPTILDAIVHPLFYPGPKAGTHGETLPLTPDLASPESRATGGEREWIHRNYQALLVSDASVPRTCRLLWYGTW